MKRKSFDHPVTNLLKSLIYSVQAVLKESDHDEHEEQAGHFDNGRAMFAGGAPSVQKTRAPGLIGRCFLLGPKNVASSRSRAYKILTDPQRQFPSLLLSFDSSTIMPGQILTF